MSNKFQTSTENSRPVRWRMHLPTEVCNHILSLAVDEERDPGEILARWVKEYYKIRYETEKESSDAQVR